MTTPERLRAALRETPGAASLDAALAAAAERPETVRRSFPAAGRHAGREALPGAPGWTADEAARALLLAALPPDRAAVTCELYRYGDADEKRAVLKCVFVTPPLLEGSGFSLPSAEVGDGQALPVSNNETVSRKRFPCRVNPTVPSLDLMAVPLAVVDGLEERADSELGAMLAAFADERGAAGRSTPGGAVALLLRLTHKEP
ncbi:hypothetical protein [Streptosporangium sp. NPDC000396]|uniref:hypothetical protein n=1 Tax=Streptosporangium sp. NPDC000396 TaxID=3366185 RepID=UPI003685FF39